MGVFWGWGLVVEASVWNFKSGLVLNLGAVNYIAHPILGFVPVGPAFGGPKTFLTFLYSGHPALHPSGRLRRSRGSGSAAADRLVRPLAERAASRRSEAKQLASLKPASTLATACGNANKKPRSVSGVLYLGAWR